MKLLPECIQALKYPAFWNNTNSPSLKGFLEFRSQTGDLDISTVEHNRYSKELNTISKYYAEASEFGRLVRKWKKDFKDCKNSKIIKLFWNMEHVVMESELVDRKSKLQWKEGILEFERTGLCHLQETSSAVQEKQISSYTSYERSTSKSETQTKKGESSSTKMVLREKRRVSYTEPETDSDSYEEKKPKKPKSVGSTSNTHLKSTESPQPAPNPSLEEDDVSDDEKVEVLQRVEVTGGILAKKLAEVSKGIARYNVIFLPESNKNDLLRATFGEEWQTFEKFFNKTEEEITSKIPSSIKKVENILSKYREALVNATDGGYVELDSVFINYNYQDGYKFRINWLENWVNDVYRKFLICFRLSRHVLNDKSSSEYQYRDWFVNLLLEDLFLDINSLIRLTTGEVENIHRKNQKNLSKLPEDRRQIGWYHDGILTVNINGVEEYIGILEVVGNAIVEDHVKMIADRDKMLKAMRLALFQLEQTLRNNGISDEKQLKHNLETFGILVDRRYFIIYVMHYYEGVYLVDETDLSFIIPDTPMQLFLIEDVIKKLLAFRARVEYLNTWIKTQSRDTASASRRHLRRITTAVDLSPGNMHKSSAKK